MGSVVFNVDTQQDFFEGGLIDIPNGESVLANLQAISDVCKKNGTKVISTIRWFKEDSDFFSEMPDWRETYPVHCLKDTKGARFMNETAPDRYFLLNWEGGSLVFPEIHKNNHIVITKKTEDVFEGNPYFESLIHNLGVPFMDRPHYVVYGVEVGKTVLGLLRRGYEVTVISDASINLNGQPFKKEDIINQQVSPDPDITPKEVLSLNFITTDQLLSQ
jgi:nicotinamidase-related amidase